MPVRERFIKAPDKRNTGQVVKAINSAIKRYASRYGSLYVGIAVDPYKRFKQHNKAVTSGRGSIHTDSPWPLCYVIFETSSDDKVRSIEKQIVAFARGNQKVSKKLWNQRGGGAGRKPRKGGKAFVYVLLDPRETKWVDSLGT